MGSCLLGRDVYHHLTQGIHVRTDRRLCRSRGGRGGASACFIFHRFPISGLGWRQKKNHTAKQKVHLCPPPTSLFQQVLDTQFEQSAQAFRDRLLSQGVNIEHTRGNKGAWRSLVRRSSHSTLFMAKFWQRLALQSKLLDDSQPVRSICNQSDTRETPGSDNSSREYGCAWIGSPIRPCTIRHAYGVRD